MSNDCQNVEINSKISFLTKSEALLWPYYSTNLHLIGQQNEAIQNYKGKIIFTMTWQQDIQIK